MKEFIITEIKDPMVKINGKWYPCKLCMLFFHTDVTKIESGKGENIYERN